MRKILCNRAGRHRNSRLRQFYCVPGGRCFVFRYDLGAGAGKTGGLRESGEILQQKIDAIKDASRSIPSTNPDPREWKSRKSELESYLLYSLKEEIPAPMDTADVQLAERTVSLETQITFTSNATGNPSSMRWLAALTICSSKANSSAQRHAANSILQDVRVDGIPVPNVLIQTSDQEVRQAQVSPKSIE